jgi:hypothetical protein
VHADDPKSQHKEDNGELRGHLPLRSPLVVLQCSCGRYVSPGGVVAARGPRRSVARLLCALPAWKHPGPPRKEVGAPLMAARRRSRFTVQMMCPLSRALASVDVCGWRIFRSGEAWIIGGVPTKEQAHHVAQLLQSTNGLHVETIEPPVSYRPWSLIVLDRSDHPHPHSRYSCSPNCAHCASEPLLDTATPG